MLGIDAEFGASLLRLWIAAGSAALLVLICVLAVLQPQQRMAASRARRVGFVAAGAVLGGAVSWAALDRAPPAHDDGAVARAFELRAQELGAQALSPGSSLACLDGLAGESVEAACEKAVFATPASVAAAASYVAARLALLSSAARAGVDADAGVDEALAPLRRSLEIDRFGIVAHVLALRDRCTREDCKALALLRDPSRVRANLVEQSFDRYVERYAPAWATPADAAVADAAPQQGAAAPAPHKIVNIDFPSAASIPAVSIMNPEPAGPVVPGAAAAAAANPNPSPAGQPPSRHTHKPAANSSAAAAAAAQSTPGVSATDPIWPEPVPPPPAASPPQAGASPAPPSASASSSAPGHTP
jgi:hypothetical protein